MKKFIGVLLLSLSQVSPAVLVTDIEIHYVGIYGDGRIFASLDKTIPVNGCESATWGAISADHMHKKEIYSLLLSALAAGKKLEINATSCLSGSATITEGTSDYIIVR